MLGKTNYTMDVQPIFNEKHQQTWCPRKDFTAESFLWGVGCEFFGVFFKLSLRMWVPCVDLGTPKGSLKASWCPSIKYCLPVVHSSTLTLPFAVMPCGWQCGAQSSALSSSRQGLGQVRAGWKWGLWAPAFLVSLPLGYKQLVLVSSAVCSN